MARTRREPSIVITYDDLTEDFKSLYDQIARVYDEQNIYDLRKIASDVGVESPTTLTKKLLVKRVTDRVIAQYMPGGVSTANVPWNIFKDAVGDETVRGLCECNNGEWFIGRISIIPLIANEHDLRDGDMIEGKITEVNGKKLLVSLTKAEYEGVKRRWFIDIPVCERRTFDSIGKKADDLFGGLHIGERVIMKEMSFQDANEIAECFDNCIKLYIGLAPEYESNMSNNTFICNFDLGKAQMASIVRLAIERCKRLAEVGKDVTLVVKGFEFLDDPELERAAFGLGRCFSRGGVTVIAEMDKTRRGGIFAKVATRIVQ